MANVGEQAFAVVHHLLYTAGHLVEGTGDLADFIVANHRHSGREIATGYSLNALMQPLQRAQQGRLHQVGETDGEQ